MATSGSFSTNEVEGRSLTFSWTQSSQSIEGNTTTISWTLKGSGTYGKDTSAYWVQGYSGSVTINGVTKSFTMDRVYNGTVVASGTQTISHNNDGKKSFSVSCSGAIYYNSQNVSGSSSWDLNTIPRAGVITSASDVTLSLTSTVNSTIKWTSYSSKFTYKITASIPASAGTAKSITSSSYSGSGAITKTLGFDSSWIDSITKTTSTTATITLTTYSGTTIIGTTTKNIALTLPSSSLTPTVSSVGVSNKTGTFSDKYCKGDTITVTTNAAAKRSATITTYSVGLYNSGSEITSGSSESIDFNLTQYGAITVAAGVTDSRGLSANGSTSINVYDYFTPQITCKYIPNDTQPQLQLTGSIAYVNNDNTVKTCIIKVVDGGQTTGTQSVDLNLVNPTDTSALDAKWTFDQTVSVQESLVPDIATATYTITVSLIDTAGNEKTASVQTGVTCLSLLAGGKGAAFFKEADTAGLVDINGNLKVSGNLNSNTLNVQGLRVGQCFRATGNFISSGWGTKSRTAELSLVHKGMYLVWMTFACAADNATMARMYKQFQMQADNGIWFVHQLKSLYYDTNYSNASECMRRTITMPIVVTEANATIYPYVHCPTDGAEFNVWITAMYMGDASVSDSSGDGGDSGGDSGDDEPYTPTVTDGLITVKTTAEWNADSTKVSISGNVYVYSDYVTDEDGTNHAGFKIGDGSAYVVDLPFASAYYEGEVVTATEKKFWNNKERTEVVGEELIFTKS